MDTLKEGVLTAEDVGTRSAGTSLLPYEASAMAALDLEPILAKLCHPTRGQGWLPQRATIAVMQYRRWLWLHAAYPGLSLSPSQDVDQVWHMHILDTRKYAVDCQAMFGKLLHHNPYAGWESEAVEAEHQINYRNTRELFAQHFASDFEGDTGLCMSGYCDAEVNAGAIWRPTMESIGFVAATH